MALSVGSAGDFRSLSRQPPPDPDIQATLSDFLAYTEHFPSHLTRALTLIGDQRLRSEQNIRQIHDDTTTYSLLPNLQEKPDPLVLRRNISYALEEAERACRMAVEEANRLDENCQREARRLENVTEKLKSQPMPPSRDPTPEQQALTSPNLKKERRMSLRADEQKLERPVRHLTDKAATKLRGRKIMVPGEVLPPPDPNAPLESISDWTSPRVSPPMEEPPMTEKKAAPPRQRSRTPKVLKIVGERLSGQDREREKKAQKPRGPRAPGQPGTNAHSAVAGISTSNALLALTQPPEDAVKGSKWLPWMKLTEWEMAKLRKRMKKNAIWVPSQTMVRRELKNLGRGVAGKEAAKAAAEAGGQEFVDEVEADPTKVVVSGEESAQIDALLGESTYMGTEDDDADAELINRGMRLNEAKKLKRQRMLEEQAQVQAQIAREQGIEVATDGQKKRKREATPLASMAVAGVTETPDPLSKPGPAPKRLKINPPAPNGTKVPLAPAGPSTSPKASSNRDRRAATPPVSRKPVSLSINTNRATSEELPNRRVNLRRGSNASQPNSANITSPLGASATATGTGKATASSSRRSKRPIPGVLTTTDDGDAKVGVSKRKAAPKKKASSAVPKTPTTTEQLLPPFEGDDYIDPDEPRYCLCGDVSYGQMIGCDNEDNCEKEWFHLSCVGLEDLPPRRTKWYCPDCRKKLKLGMGTNGLVGRQQSR